MEESTLIDWQSDQSHLLINPSYPDSSQLQFSKILEQSHRWPAHVWLATSGSTVKKWVGLSKEALLTSAKAVNQHLQSGPFDRWALALPEFHVGGIGIRVRSFLSGAKVFDFKSVIQNAKWNARLFYDFLTDNQVTLTSLVPSQLFDLIHLDLKSPTHLRAVVIGGDRLLPELGNRALERGWNLLPSYGLTECGSSVATASLQENSKLKILSHLQSRTVEGRLAFKGSSLLSTYAYFEEDQLNFIDPKVDGWFISMDRGEVNGNFLSIFGRIDEYIKIGGENVDISRLEMILQTLKLRLQIRQSMTLLAIPDVRLGHIIHLVIEGTKDESVEQVILTSFHDLVLPFERIRHISRVEEIPKSALSKVLRKDLINHLK